MTPGPERRAAPRVVARLEAAYEDTERQVFLPSHDVSELGVFLLSEDLPVPGTSARLTLELPGQPEMLRLRGVVTRCQQAPCGFAVRFEDASLSNPIRSALRRYVTRPATP